MGHIWDIKNNKEANTIRNLYQLSIDELLDKQAELHEARAEGEPNVLRELIQVEETLFTKINRSENSPYKDSLVMLKKQLVKNLLHYGSYLKTEYRKDDNAAKVNLKKALRYERHIPMAHYRLGFLAYKHKQYLEATIHFQNSLQIHKRNPDHNDALTPQQLYNATLYLSNSALYIAKDAQESLDYIEGDVEEKSLNLELSPLFHIITQNETYLQSNAYTIQTMTSKKGYSIDECEQMIESRAKDQVILYFSDREVFVYYGKRHIHLSIDQAYILREFMTESSEDHPLAKDDLNNYIASSKPNTYITRVRRLRERLANLGIPSFILTTVPRRQDSRETAYYYNHKSFPYMLIQRTDTL